MDMSASYSISVDEIRREVDQQVIALVYSALRRKKIFGNIKRLKRRKVRSIGHRKANKE